MPYRTAPPYVPLAIDPSPPKRTRPALILGVTAAVHLAALGALTLAHDEPSRAVVVDVIGAHVASDGVQMTGVHRARVMLPR